MSNVEDYRNNAEDCLRMADADQDQQDRPLWATLAVSWLKLAEDVNRIRSGQLSHPTDLDQFQALLDTFQQHYNTARPHRALPERRTPAQAYTALPKANPHRPHDTVPHPPRHRRPIRQTHPAPRQPPAPPRHRTHPRTHTPALILVNHRHSHRHHQNRLPTHRQPPHRRRPQLLAQPTQKPRPMAGESVTDDATQV